MNENTKALLPITPDGSMGPVLNSVRLALAARRNQEEEEKGFRGCWLGGLLGTIAWMAALSFIAVLLPYWGGYPLRIALSVNIAIPLLIVASLTYGILIPSAFAVEPTVSADKNTSFGVLGNILFVLLFPMGIGLSFCVMVSTIWYDPIVNKNDSDHLPKQRASAVLADDRTKKLYAGLARAIDDWNAATVPMNRMIWVAANQKRDLSESEAAVIADCRKKRDELIELLELAENLLTEGPIGTVMKYDASDAEDPLSRLSSRTSEIQDGVRALSDESLHLVAAREANAANNRT